MRTAQLAAIAGLFVVTTLAAMAHAEEPSGLLPLVAYDEKAGFERWSIRSLAQDTRGTLWIGTDTGLFTYDGHRARPVVSPGSHFFKDIAAGRNGDMWCLTSDGVLLWREGQWKEIAVPAQAPLQV